MDEKYKTVRSRILSPDLSIQSQSNGFDCDDRKGLEER